MQGIEPFSACFTFVNASAKNGDLPTSKSANAHDVASNLLARDESPTSIIAAHAIYGHGDLLVLLKAKDPRDLVTRVNSQIRNQDIGRTSFVTGTQSCAITSWFGKPPVRETFTAEKSVSAWVLAIVAGDPADLAPSLVNRPGVKVAAPVFGPWDLFIYVERDTPEQLQWVIDEEIRTLRYLESTVTLSVTKRLVRRP